MFCPHYKVNNHDFDGRGIVSADLYRKLMFDKLKVNEGMLEENVVAQMLRAAGHKLSFSVTVPGHQQKTVYVLPNTVPSYPRPTCFTIRI